MKLENKIKMLAEFVGFVETEFDKDMFYYPANWNLDPIDDDKFELDIHYENMEFRYSFDWLMKVLDKVYIPYTISMSYEKNTDTYRVLIRALDDDGQMKSFNNATNDKIESLFRTIVELTEELRI